MANELRQYSAFQGGMLDAKVDTTAGGSFTFSSPAFANLPAVDSAHHMLLTIDPLGMNGAPEVAKVTGHGAAATTLTASGSQNTSVGRIHYKNEYWTATWEVDDAPGQGFGLIALKYYTPGTDTTVGSVTSTTPQDVDATNAVVGFTAPPSGKVLVSLTGGANSSAGDFYWWGLRESTTDLADANGNIKHHTSGVTSSVMQITVPILITGLTGGSSHTYKWSHSVASGTGSVVGGPTRGAVVLKVEGVNV